MAKVTDIGNGGRAPLGFRTLPHNEEIEQRVVAACVFSSQARELITKYLEPTHFYEPLYGRVFAIIKRYKDRLVDFSVLKPEFDQDEAFRDVNGGDFINALASIGSTVLPDDADQLGREIQELAVRRGIINVAEEASNLAYDLSVEENASAQIIKLRDCLDTLQREVPLRIAPPHVDLSRLEFPLPSRRFIVDQWIPIGHVTSIYGEGSAGKSFLSMILGNCVAAGIPWLGSTVTCQCNVLGFFCEDNDDELLIREHQILKGLSLNWRDINGRFFLCGRVGAPNTMMSFEHGKPPGDGPAMEDLILKIRETNARLIILDNIGHLYGGNENDRFQVTSFLNRLAGIGREIDGAIVLLGHPPKSDSQYSGSTAWSNNVRSRLWLKKDPDDDDRWMLERAKSNYSEPCKLELIRDHITGLVRPDDPAYETDESRRERDAKLGGARTHILNVLDKLNAREQYTSERRTAPNYFVKVANDEKLSGAFKPLVLSRALESLMDDGLIIRDVVGKYAKGAKQWGLVRTSSLK